MSPTRFARIALALFVAQASQAAFAQDGFPLPGITDTTQWITFRIPTPSSQVRYLSVHSVRSMMASKTGYAGFLYEGASEKSLTLKNVFVMDFFINADKTVVTLKSRDGIVKFAATAKPGPNQCVLIQEAGDPTPVACSPNNYVFYNLFN
jgi:hypothetical protein